MSNVVISLLILIKALFEHVSALLWIWRVQRWRCMLMCCDINMPPLPQPQPISSQSESLLHTFLTLSQVPRLPKFTQSHKSLMRSASFRREKECHHGSFWTLLNSVESVSCTSPVMSFVITFLYAPLRKNDCFWFWKLFRLFPINLDPMVLNHQKLMINVCTCLCTATQRCSLLSNEFSHYVFAATMLTCIPITCFDTVIYPVGVTPWNIW